MGQWNIDGLATNIHSLNTLMEDNSLDIMNCQETNLRRATAQELMIALDDDYTMNANCGDDGASLSDQLSDKAAFLAKAKGTATFWKQNSPLQITPLPTPTHQMTATRITYNTASFLNVPDSQYYSSTF